MAVLRPPRHSRGIPDRFRERRCRRRLRQLQMSKHRQDRGESEGLGGAARAHIHTRRRARTHRATDSSARRRRAPTAFYALKLLTRGVYPPEATQQLSPPESVSPHSTWRASFLVPVCVAPIRPAPAASNRPLVASRRCCDQRPQEPKVGLRRAPPLARTRADGRTNGRTWPVRRCLGLSRGNRRG